MSTCATYLKIKKTVKDRRQTIIITCEPEDTKLVEDALDKIDFDKSQGTIQIKYEPSLRVNRILSLPCLDLP